MSGRRPFTGVSGDWVAIRKLYNKRKAKETTMTTWLATLEFGVGHHTTVTATFTGPHWWLPRGVQGIAIGERVYLKRDWPDKIPTGLVLHELCHVRQWRRFGWLGFPIKYAWQWVRAGFRPARMPLEKEARRWQYMTGQGNVLTCTRKRR